VELLSKEEGAALRAALNPALNPAWTDTYVCYRAHPKFVTERIEAAITSVVPRLFDGSF
jgi:hypothetical protein